MPKIRKNPRPRWSQLMIAASELERQAAEFRSDALTMRCMTEDGGGARCTADGQPEHAHRYEQEDLPR